MILKKLIAKAVLLAFTVTSLNSFTFASQATALSKKLIITSNLGKITDSFNGSKKQRVICIQDRHCDPGVESNIAKIIKEIKDLYGKDFTFLGTEGSTGEINTDILGAVPDNDIKLDVTYKYLNQGYITGPELYSIMYPNTATLYGVEDPELYKQDFIRLYESLNNYRSWDHIFDEIESSIVEIKEYLYPKKLKEFEDILKKYDNGKLEMYTYLSYLYEVSNENNINIELSYPTVNNYYKAKHILRQIDPYILKTEIKEMKKMIKSLLTEDEVNTINVVAGDKDIIYLKNLIKEKNISIGSNYPTANKYFLYLDLLDKVDYIKFSEEESDLKYNLKLNLTDSIKDAKNLVYCEYFLNKMRNYFESKTSSIDTIKWQRDKETFFEKMQTFGALLTRINYFKEHKILLENLNKNMDVFYNLADKRNEAMLSNLLKEGKDSPVKVIVFGGYHTNYIKQFLRSKNISFDIIMPESEKIYDRDLYIKRVDGQAKVLGLSNQGTHTNIPTYANKFLMMMTEFTNKDFNRQLFQDIVNKTIKKHNTAQSFINFLNNYQRDMKVPIGLENIVLWSGKLDNKDYSIYHRKEKFRLEEIKKEKKSRGFLSYILNELITGLKRSIYKIFTWSSSKQNIKKEQVETRTFVSEASSNDTYYKKELSILDTLDTYIEFRKLSKQFDPEKDNEASKTLSKLIEQTKKLRDRGILKGSDKLISNLERLIRENEYILDMILAERPSLERIDKEEERIAHLSIKEELAEAKKESQKKLRSLYNRRYITQTVYMKTSNRKKESRLIQLLGEYKEMIDDQKIEYQRNLLYTHTSYEEIKDEGEERENIEIGMCLDLQDSNIKEYRTLFHILDIKQQVRSLYRKILATIPDQHSLLSDLKIKLKDRRKEGLRDAIYQKITSIKKMKSEYPEQEKSDTVTSSFYLDSEKDNEFSEEEKETTTDDETDSVLGVAIPYTGNHQGNNHHRSQEEIRIDSDTTDESESPTPSEGEIFDYSDLGSTISSQLEIRVQFEDILTEIEKELVEAKKDIESIIFVEDNKYQNTNTDLYIERKGNNLEVYITKDSYISLYKMQETFVNITGKNDIFKALVKGLFYDEYANDKPDDIYYYQGLLESFRYLNKIEDEGGIASLKAQEEVLQHFYKIESKLSVIAKQKIDIKDLVKEFGDIKFDLVRALRGQEFAREIIVPLDKINSSDEIEPFIKKLALIEDIRAKKVRLIFVGDIANYSNAKAFDESAEIIKKFGKYGAVWVLGHTGIEFLNKEGPIGDIMRKLNNEYIAIPAYRTVDGKLITGTGFVSIETLDAVKKNKYSVDERNIAEILQVVMHFNTRIENIFGKEILKDFNKPLDDGEKFSDRIPDLKESIEKLGKEQEFKDFELSYEGFIRLMSMRRFIYGEKGILNIVDFNYEKELKKSDYVNFRQLPFGLKHKLKEEKDITTSPAAEGEEQIAHVFRVLPDLRVFKETFSVKDGEHKMINTELLTPPVLNLDFLSMNQGIKDILIEICNIGDKISRFTAFAKRFLKPESDIAKTLERYEHASLAA